MPDSLVSQEDFAVAECPSYLIKLDLACGSRKKEGFMGVDISPDVKPDVIADLNVYPWTWVEDNGVFQIHASHFIEHVHDIKAFMEECYRILVPMGTIHIIAPYYSSIRASQDYTHVRLISENTFLYFNQAWMKDNKLEHYGVKCDFENIGTRYYYNPDWESRADVAREWARVHYINTVADIEVTLKAIK